MRGDAVPAEYAGVVGNLGGSPPEPLLGILDLSQRLVEVDVDAGTELVSQDPGVSQQFGIATRSGRSTIVRSKDDRMK